MKKAGNKSYLITAQYTAVYAGSEALEFVQQNEQGWLEGVFAKYPGTNVKVIKCEESQNVELQARAVV